MRQGRERTTLVIGADSTIGNALLQQLADAGEDVIGSTRRADSHSGHMLYLDLADDPASWPPLPTVNTAVLCAAITQLAQCEDKALQSRIVNVRAAVELAKRLHHNGARVIFLSTNQVFDGTIPYRSQGDTTCPQSEYGRQKADAETRLLAVGEWVSILRLTKVLGETNSRFQTWASVLRSGETLTVPNDLYMAPIPLSAVISVLQLMRDRETEGIVQLSGDQDISMADCAIRMAACLKVSPDRVRSVPASDLAIPATWTPRYTTLSVHRLQAEFGIEPPPVEWLLGRCFAGL